MRWFLLLLCFFELSGSFARANSCECPGPKKDALARPQCAPRPAALNADPSTAVKDESCPTCFYNPTAWLNPAVENLTADLQSRKKIRSSPLDSTSKDRQSLDTYLNCNRENTAKDQARFCHYKDTLAPLIALAAKSAHQPFAVQACLFKQESAFSPTAKSHAGAAGYIQFMPRTGRSVGTMADVNDILKETAEEMRQKLVKLEAHIEDLKQKGQERSVLRNIAEHKGQFARYRARLVWDKYWEGTSHPPKNLESSDVHCPNTAFVASLMKQTVDLFLMTSFSSNEHPDERMPKIGHLDAREMGIFLGGAYNTSPKRFAKKCGAASSLPDCIRRIENHETHKHLIALDHCSEPGNWLSIEPDDDSKKYILMKCEETSKCTL